MTTDFPKKVRRSVIDNLKREIELSTPERASEIVFKALLYRRSFGFTDEELDELKEVYKKKLEEVV